MIGTFASVLFFTMLKEGYEDKARHASDNELNNKTTHIYDYESKQFVDRKWREVKVG
jgi:hypothetical protein